MEHIVEIAGVTEEDLLASALDRLASLVDKPPDLGPGEFTRTDAMIRLGMKDSMVERELERLVAAGVLGKAERHNSKTGRKCVGYWFKEEKG